MDSNIPSFATILRWGIKGGWSILDQVTFSVANFIFNLFLARWLSIQNYGIFSITFVALIFAYQIYVAAIIEPMAIIGPSNYKNDLRAYLTAQVRLHFFLTMPGGLVFGVMIWVYQAWFGDTALFAPLFIMGLTLPFLLAPWLLRRIFYVLAHPEISFLGSLIYAFLLLGLMSVIYSLDNLTPVTGILLIAFAGSVSSVVMFIMLRSKQSSALSLWQVFSENWKLGKWLIASALVIAIASQAQIFLAASLLSLSEAGILRALQTLIQPMLLSITSLSALVTPGLAADFATANWKAFKRKSFLLIIVLLIAASLFELFLIFFHTALEALLYDGKFSSYSSLLPVWGAITILLALTSGMQVSFQAAKLPTAMLWSSISWVAFSVGLGYYLTVRAGVWGSTLSAVVGYLVLAISLSYFYWKWILFPLADKEAKS